MNVFHGFLRPVSGLIYSIPIRTIATFRTVYSKQAISSPSGLLLEAGDIDSDSEEMLSPSVKNKDETIITVPIRLKKRLEKKLIKENTAYFQKQKIINASRVGRKARIVVKCKRQDFNHYYGQTYAKGAEIPLASNGWAHRKSVGDYFTINGHDSRVSSAFALSDENFSFDDLGLDSALNEIVRENNIFRPTDIQMFAVPQILKRNNCLVAAETGCGKTLAYLLPLLQQILGKKSKEPTRKVNQPYAIVLLPSRELADQVYEVALLFAKQLNIKVKVLQGGNVGAKIKDPSTSVVDLLIATVSVASALTSVGVFDPSEVEHVVLDEADSLLDDSFSDLVIEFLKKFKFFQDGELEPCQISLVSATLPRSVDSILGEVVPVDSLVRITTPHLHKVLSHVPQTFLRLRKSEKPDKILEIIQKDVESQIPVMIFSNKNSTCDWLSHHLQNSGVECVTLHGKKILKYRKGVLGTYQSGKTNIINCTDLGSRGLDTLRTGHVINYDFPNFLSDYIHRCGRTGRVGSTIDGRVTNFISKPHEVILVQEIEKSVRKELSLEKVNANIKRILNARYGMYQQILPPREDEKDEYNNNT